MNRIFRRGTLVGLGAGAVLALAAGIAYATIPDSNGTIHACYKNGNGALRAIDTASSSCNANETAIDLGGPTHGYAGLHTGSVMLFEMSLPIDRIQLPAGKYLLHAKTNIANFSFGSSTGVLVPCDLRVEGTSTQIDFNEALLEGPATTNEAYIEGLSFQAPLTLSAPAFVDLECAYVPRGPGVTQVEARASQIDAISLDSVELQGS